MSEVNPFSDFDKEFNLRKESIQKSLADKEEAPSAVEPSQASKVESLSPREKTRPVHRVLNGVFSFFKKHSGDAQQGLSGLLAEVQGKAKEFVSEAQGKIKTGMESLSGKAQSGLEDVSARVQAGLGQVQEKARSMQSQVQEKLTRRDDFTLEQMTADDFRAIIEDFRPKELKRLKKKMEEEIGKFQARYSQANRQLQNANRLLDYGGELNERKRSEQSVLINESNAKMREVAPTISALKINLNKLESRQKYLKAHPEAVSLAPARAEKTETPAPTQEAEPASESADKAEPSLTRQESKKLEEARIRDLLSEGDYSLSSEQLDDLLERFNKQEIDDDEKVHALAVLYLYGRIGLILGKPNLTKYVDLLRSKGVNLRALGRVRTHVEQAAQQSADVDVADNPESSWMYRLGFNLGEKVQSLRSGSWKNPAAEPESSFEESTEPVEQTAAPRSITDRLQALLNSYKARRSERTSQQEEEPVIDTELEKAADDAQDKLQLKGLWGLLVNAPHMIEALDDSVEKTAAICVMVEQAAKELTADQKQALEQAGFTDEVLAKLRERYTADNRARMDQTALNKVGQRLLELARNREQKQEARTQARQETAQSKQDYKEVKQALKNLAEELKELDEEIMGSQQRLEERRVEGETYAANQEQGRLARLREQRAQLVERQKDLTERFQQLLKEKKERDLELRKDLIMAIVGLTMVEAGLLIGTSSAGENLKLILNNIRSVLEKHPDATASQFRALGDQLTGSSKTLYQTVVDNLFSKVNGLSALAERVSEQASSSLRIEDVFKGMSDAARKLVDQANRSASSLNVNAQSLKAALESARLPELTYVDQFKDILANLDIKSGENVWDTVVPKLREVLGTDIWQGADADQAQYIMGALKDLFPELNTVAPGANDFSNLLQNTNVSESFQRLFESKNVQEAKIIVAHLKDLKASGVF